jgi:hypothetical protein
MEYFFVGLIGFEVGRTVLQYIFSYIDNRNNKINKLWSIVQKKNDTLCRWFRCRV